MTTITIQASEREPFPVATFDGHCPACGELGSVQSVCLAPHYWGGAEVVDGVLTFDGGFDYDDATLDSHIGCQSCGADWAEPEKVEYR